MRQLLYKNIENHPCSQIPKVLLPLGFVVILDHSNHVTRLSLVRIISVLHLAGNVHQYVPVSRTIELAEVESLPGTKCQMTLDNR